MDSGSYRAAIITTAITVAGTLGAALIAHWDKVFGPPKAPVVASPASVPAGPAGPADPVQSNRAEHQPVPVETQPERAPSQAAPAQAPSIAGTWRDTDNPGTSTVIAQDGSRFQLTRWGMLEDGTRFESRGTGTLSGQRVALTYQVRYESGAASMGDCSGSVSANGGHMDLACRDSLLGAFAGALVRQDG